MSGRFAETIAKLKAWSAHDFHGDRQLADEVLLADGWRPIADPNWEGGVRWERQGFPIVNVCEEHRPHVIYDMNTALAVIPYRCSVNLHIAPSETSAVVFNTGAFLKGPRWYGVSPIATIAVLIAALQAIDATSGSAV